MPLWVISLLITLLQKTGVLNWLEGVAVKGGLEGLEALKKVKIEYTYPIGKDGQ